MFEKSIGQKPREPLDPLFGYRLSQSIGRGRISREGSRTIRASRERRDNFYAGKKPFWPSSLDQKQQFSMAMPIGIGEFNII